MQHRLAHRAKVALRQREYHGARLDLGEHRERIGIGGVDDVADIDLAEADHAVDRRRDGRVIELGLRRLDGGLIGVDGRLCLIDLGLLGVEFCCVSAFLSTSVLKRAKSFSASISCASSSLFLATAWSRAAWNGAGSILRQHVAFADVLALAEIDGNDLAVDLSADRDGIKRLDGAERVIIDRHVLLGRFGNYDRNRGRRWPWLFGYCAWRQKMTAAARAATAMPAIR